MLFLEYLPTVPLFRWSYYLQLHSWYFFYVVSHNPLFALEFYSFFCLRIIDIAIQMLDWDRNKVIGCRYISLQLKCLLYQTNKSKVEKCLCYLSSKSQPQVVMFISEPLLWADNSKWSSVNSAMFAFPTLWENTVVWRFHPWNVIVSFQTPRK